MLGLDNCGRLVENPGMADPSGEIFLSGEPPPTTRLAPRLMNMVTESVPVHFWHNTDKFSSKWSELKSRVFGVIVKSYLEILLPAPHQVVVVEELFHPDAC